jgi:protein-tyrosine-phosphatase
MAEAIFNKLKPSGFQAVSAGTRPASEVNPLVIQALGEIGIDASNNRPKPISPGMIADAERIIAMGCEAADFCPARFLPKVEDWKIEDPMGKSIDGIRLIRDAIRERVETLLQELEST